MSAYPNHETRVHTRRTGQLTFEDEKQIKKRGKRHSETCGSKFSIVLNCHVLPLCNKV